MKLVVATTLLGMALPGACSTSGTRPTPPLPAASRAIVVCGREFPIDARIIRWDNRGGYDGYLETGFFDRSNVLPTQPAYDCNTPQRYSVRAGLVENDDTKMTDEQLIRRHVDQIVIHYDAAGTSRRCFQTLHDIRGLSSHFLIDRDGTIYQTLDVRERARHAGTANDRSVGIEIANVGAYESRKDLVRAVSEAGLSFSEQAITGVVQGKYLYQLPFTDSQYDALVALIHALRDALPAVASTIPRDERGRVETRVLSRNRQLRFKGVLGHLHVTDRKVDPGPAFDWVRLKVR